MNLDQSLLSDQSITILSQSQENIFFDNKEHYDELINILTDHNHLYYITNKPIISDEEYDRLFSLLLEFESRHPELIRDDSPSQGLKEQYEIQSGFEKSSHQVPILSLQNTYDAQDILERYESITKLIKKNSDIHPDSELGTPLDFIVEPKYDGLSIVLTYKNGKLRKAVTRGDGYIGDDVTANIKTIKNLPLVIPSDQTIIVRGEVMMPKSVRKKLNVSRKEQGEEVFANTRNAAAGSLKLLDTNLVAKRQLVCYIYEIISGPIESLQYFDYLKPEEIFTRGNTYSIQEIIDFITHSQLQDVLLHMDVDFDGLVIKVNDLKTRALLGNTNHHPRRAIAFKFPAQQAASQIRSISWQVGRTGVLTPVAQIDPTALSGATISRVSLHNRDFIHSKNIYLYDWIWLQRSGEVIPYVLSAIIQRRDGSQIELKVHDIVCSSCKTQAKKIENIVGTKAQPQISTQILCPNPSCPGILKEKLKHFVSKNAMDIGSLGEATLELLVDQGLLTSLSDIYSLDQAENIFLFKRLPGIGDKKIDTFIEEIHSSKQKPLRRLINSLGIPGIGIKLAKEIEYHLSLRHPLPSQLESAFSLISQRDFLQDIFGVGDKIIQDIHAWYAAPYHKSLISKFASYGIVPIFSQSNDKRYKKTIAITGTFPLSRSELEFFINQAGFQFVTQLSRHTDYLLIGDKPGSKKDKVGHSTKVIDNIQQIYSLLHISAPLFEEKSQKGNSQSSGSMQSLFG